MTRNQTTYAPCSASEFNRRIDEGIRRAPEERAKAIRDFWDWLVRR